MANLENPEVVIVGGGIGGSALGAVLAGEVLARGLLFSTGLPV